MKDAYENLDEVLKVLPAKFQPGTKEYFINGLQLAWTIDFLGGRAMEDSHIAAEAVRALMDLGMSKADILSAIKFPS